MLASGVYRNSISVNIRQFSAYTTCKNNTHSRNSSGSVDAKFSVQGLHRSYSNEPQTEQRVRLPQLMDFPELTWPSFFNTMRNWVLTNMVIRPYLDKEFSMMDFVTGSKQAMSVISTALARGDYESLNGLVTETAIQSLKEKINTFTMQQREEISVAREDIYFSFPYQVGIMFNDDTEVQERSVEITMVYHVLRGLQKSRDEGNPPPVNMGMLPEYQKRISICNYRFRREFTKESPWVVNVVNHFKPIDVIEKMDEAK